MDYKLMALELAAIVVSYMIMMLPVTSATTVNIIFGGETRDTVQISPEPSIDHSVTIIQGPFSIEARMSVSGLGIENIYVYKCGKSSITECMEKIPDEYTNSANHDYDWSVISQQEGDYFYPQVANLLILVRRTGANSNTIWNGLWYHIERNGPNTFNIFSGEGNELNNLDVHVKSEDLVSATHTFINNYQMIPFTWLNRAEFTDSGVASLYQISGTEAEFESMTGLGAGGVGKEITSMIKDYYLEFPKSTSQNIGNAITLNLNPSFTCGNGQAEADLGENSDNCCYDVGCPDDQYCDISDVDIMNGNYENGICRDESAIVFSSVTVNPLSIKDCDEEHDVTVTAAISNSPSSLLDTLESRIKIGAKTFTPECTKQGGSYVCTLSMGPNDLDLPECGSENIDVGNGANTIELTLEYNDGYAYHDQGKKTLQITGSFDDIDVEYSCDCNENEYCDIGNGIGTGTESCKATDNMQIVILPNTFTSYIHYNVGGSNFIELSVELLNMPGGYASDSVPVTLTLGTLNYDDVVLPQPTGGDVDTVPFLSRKATCNRNSAYTDRFVYDCSFEFSIDNYDSSNTYIFQGNELKSEITYLDGAIQRTRELVLAGGVGDIFMPTQDCGNGYVDEGETADTCCVDVGCKDAYGIAYFCDPNSEPQCKNENSIVISDITLDDSTFRDAELEHEVKITSQIDNMPSDIAIDTFDFSIDGEAMTGWTMSCGEPTETGRLECIAVIPELDYADLPAGMEFNSQTNKITIGRNSLNLSVTFTDQYHSSTKGQINRNLGANFDDIMLEVVPHCGNGECETGLDENASVCCLDCACEDDQNFGSDYFCDYHEIFNPDGECLEKSGVQFIVDSVGPVYFDTCEKENEVNIVGHVENEPHGMKMQSYWADVGGSGSDRLSCKQFEVTGTDPPRHVINCTLEIPSITECSQGQTYIYEPNEIGMQISYNNRNITETAILGSTLPTVTITQSFKSLYDIVRDSIGELRSSLDKIQDQTEELLDWIEGCVEIAMLLSFLSIVAMIAVPFATGDNVKWTDAVSATTTASSTIINSWMNICEFMVEMYDTQMKVIEAEMEITKMNLCIETTQHMLDMDMCKGNEKACFLEMARCVDFDALDSVMDDIVKNVKDMGDLMEESGAGITEGANAIGVLFEDPTGEVSFDCDSYEAGGNYCCGYREESDGTFGLSEVKIKIKDVEYCDDKSMQNFALWVVNDNGDLIGGSEIYVDDDYNGNAVDLFKKTTVDPNVPHAAKYKIGFICKEKDKVKAEDLEDVYKAETINFCKGTKSEGCRECGGRWKNLADSEYTPEIELEILSKPEKEKHNFGDEITVGYTNSHLIKEKENEWYICGKHLTSDDGEKTMEHIFTVDDVDKNKDNELECEIKLKTEGLNEKNVKAKKTIEFENRKPTFGAIQCVFYKGKLNGIKATINDKDIEKGKDEIDASFTIEDAITTSYTMSCNLYAGSNSYMCSKGGLFHDGTGTGATIEITAWDELGGIVTKKCTCDQKENGPSPCK